MTSLHWQRRLDAASSDMEVLGAARAFVADLTPVEIARLPAHCRPGPMSDVREIAAYAHVLVRHHCGDDGAAQRLVDRLTGFFSAASRRLGEVRTS